MPKSPEKEVVTENSSYPNSNHRFSGEYMLHAFLVKLTIPLHKCVRTLLGKSFNITSLANTDVMMTLLARRCPNNK